MEGLPVFKNFVNVRREISVRWKSDDPCFVKADEDMYDVQREGVPADMGKKDKSTGVQCFFVCHVCDDLEVSSIKTLEAHCGGVQHRNKSTEFREKLRVESMKGITTIPGNILDRVCDGEKKLLGIGFLIEYNPTKNDRSPIYFCAINECRVFRGNIDDTLQHLKSETHFHAVKEIVERPSDGDPTRLNRIWSIKDFNDARNNKVPESFFREQSRVHKMFTKKERNSNSESNSESSTRSRSRSPIRRQSPPSVKQEPLELPFPFKVSPIIRRDPLPWPNDGQNSNTASRSGSSPSFSALSSTSSRAADDMEPIKKFDMMLETYARERLMPHVIASQRGDINKYIKDIKIDQKRNHLRKGVTLDTIKFTDETKKVIDDVAKSMMRQ